MFSPRPAHLARLARLAGLLLATASLACGTAGQQRPKTDPDSRRVRSVTIVGNERFPAKKILAKLETRPSTWLRLAGQTRHREPRQLRLDRKRVAAFYQERGYFSANVTEVALLPVGDRRVDVRMTVEEGEPTRVESVSTPGLPAAWAAELREELASLGIRRGAVLVHEKYLVAREELRQALRKRGFVHAVVKGEVRVDRDRRAAAVILLVDAGPRVRFGKTQVSGNDRIPTETVLARVAWKEGDIFDLDALEATRKQLADLRLFGVVRLDFARKGRPPVADVRIHVTEGDRNSAKLGVGVTFDSERVELRGRAHYTRTGLFHPLITAGLDLEPKYTLLPGRQEEQEFFVDVGARLDKHDFLYPRLQLGTALRLESQLFAGFSTRGPRARATLSRPLAGNRLRATLGWQMRLLDVAPADAVVADAIDADGWYRLAFFEQSLSRDGRDDRRWPSSGTFAELKLEEGGAFAGGTYPYVKVTADLRGYVPLGSRTVLAARCRGGVLEAGEQGSPVTQRYFGGGAGHRGFDFRRLSPIVLDEDGDFVPIGGTALLEASVEARLFLGTVWGLPVRTALFLDGGDVTPAVGDISLGHLHWAVGAGLRVDLPVGPIRVDVGRRLNRLSGVGPNGLPNPQPGSRYSLSISLGEAF